MLETLAIVLLALWLLGIVTSYTMGGLIHALVVIAVIAVPLGGVRGRCSAGSTGRESLFRTYLRSSGCVKPCRGVSPRHTRTSV